ncbi:MAG: hypothetical protein IJK81_12315 [Selenomonadaceae bacterium]|nr:hypothetical protein [Selenomonadaceae bacterium]
MFIENLDFNGGTILESSIDVGGFFGNMLDEMKNYQKKLASHFLLIILMTTT